MLTRLLPLSVLSATFLMGFKSPEANQQNAAFKPHMQSIYSSVVQVMPLLLKDDSKIRGKERDEIEIQLKNLAEQSRSIKELSLKSDAGHQAIAKDLAVSAEGAWSQFKNNQQDQARVLLSDVIHTCFGCHTSRESSGDSQFVTNFNRDVKWESLEPLARARFLALSRQFDTSLKEYEKLLKSGSLSEDEFVNLDPVVEYLILGLRVKNDPAQVEKTLTAIKLDPYPEIVKKDLRAWARTLADMKKEKPNANALAEAKNQMALAKQTMEYPHDRSSLVRYITASRLLQEFVQGKSVSAADKADAYYNLGLCEAVVDVNLFADQSLAYFEETIKLAPKTDLSKKAFAQFEEIIRFSYSGSAGTNIPDSEKEKIKTLKKAAF